jgi:hypothetical protein
MGFKSGMQKIGSALFGDSGYDQQDTMTAEQKAQYNKMLAQGGALTGGAYDALGAGIAEGYNPYDAVGSQRILGEMKGDMRRDFNNEVGNLSGSNVGRFGSGFNKARGDLVNQYNKNITNIDYQDLMNQQQMGQQAYGNKMNAVNALLGQQSGLLNRQAVQNQNTQGTGIAQIAGGIGGIASMASKILGG